MKLPDLKAAVLELFASRDPEIIAAAAAAAKAPTPAPTRKALDFDSWRAGCARLVQLREALTAKRASIEKQLEAIVAKRATLERDETTLLEQLHVAVDEFAVYSARATEALLAGAPLVIDELRAIVAGLVEEMRGPAVRVETVVAWPRTDVGVPASNERDCVLRWRALEELAAAVEQLALSGLEELELRRRLRVALDAVPAVRTEAELQRDAIAFLRKHGQPGYPLSWVGRQPAVFAASGAFTPPAA